MAISSGSTELKKKFRNNFAGGTDYYAGIRTVADNASPLSTNCDFKGSGGVGNRLGYAQAGTVTSSRTQIWGMNEYHTSSLDYLIKFASNGSNIQLGYGTGGSWTFDSSFSFTDQLNLDSVEANSLLYSFNGIDAMQEWNGATWTATTDGKILKYGAYYNNRLWGVDPTALDTIWFSVTSTADFASAGSGSITIFPGSGAVVTAIHVFSDNLYAFLNGSIKGIFKIAPASTANTFTVTMITNTIGCVSHRSVTQVENDIYFASDDGIYTLGAVANYISPRTTNRSLRMQPVFDSLSGSSKQRLVGKYFNFKYHLFYPLFGGDNDSCLVYDIRYQAMQDWRNMAAQDATTFTDSTRTTRMYFGHPSTGEVYQMYSGITDAGTAITSLWSSKSFDEGYADTEKLYFDSTFIFTSVNGTLNLSVVFDDSTVSSSTTLTQQNPQGGFGFSKFGRSAFGANANMVTVVQVSAQPERLHAKGKKFAIQYVVSTTGAWTLDTVTQTYQILPHYAFPSALKIN
jgi:hypothetical protein